MRVTRITVGLLTTIIYGCAEPKLLAQAPMGNLFIADRPQRVGLKEINALFSADGYEKSLQLSAEMDEDGSLRVKLSEQGVTIGEAILSSTAAPNLDLSSIYIGQISFNHETEQAGAISIDFRFGDQANCFGNDDGRNFATFLFRRNGEHTTYLTLFPDCTARTVEISSDGESIIR